MSLSIALQINPLADMKIAGDTSFALALEAQRRGWRLFFYEADSLVWQGGGAEGVLMGEGQYAELADDEGAHIASSTPARVSLAEMDIILMRQDPPFDMGYLTAAYLLAGLASKTLVLNAPESVLAMPEKIFCTRFAHLMPPTLISHNKEALEEFCQSHGEVVLKPLYGGAGADIVRSDAKDSNFPLLVDFLLQRWGAPVMIQKYLPEIAQGDRRVILIEGKAEAALNRVPPKGGLRANLAAGGQGEWVPLDARDKEIAAEVGGELARRGVLLAGLDIIGGFLTEINITSPTGMRQIMAQGGPDLPALFWDAALVRLERQQGKGA